MPDRRFGFTTRASCLLAAGLTAILCGVVLGEIDLVRAGVLAAAIPIAAAVVVHRSRLRIANRRSLEPAHISAGQSVTVHLTISNRSVLPTGALMLEDQLPDRLPGRARFVLESLSGHESRTVSYRLPALGRGRYRAGPLRVRLNDPFRMIDLTRSFTSTNEFVVTPVVEQLPPIEPPRSDELGNGSGSHSVGSHGADDASTREYRTGDDLRKIHWRSSARTGSLMVRQEERPWRTQSSVLLDLRAGAHVNAGDVPGVDPRFTNSLEWAISAAASIGTNAMRSGRDIWLVDDPGRDELLRFGDPTVLARHLALARAQRHDELAPIARPLRTAARDSALVAVVGRLNPGDLQLLAEVQPRARSTPALGVLLDVDSWAADAPVDGVADGVTDGVTDGLSDGAVANGTLTDSPVPEPSLPQSGPALSPADTCAQLLRAAGWRVVVARRGDSIAQLWQLLLAGLPSAAYSPAAAMVR